MRSRLVLLFFLVSGSLIGMDDTWQGQWDDSGNYLGPENPMPDCQFVMVPPGFGVFLYPLSQVPHGFPFYTAAAAPEAQSIVQEPDTQAGTSPAQVTTTQDNNPVSAACCSTDKSTAWADVDDNDQPPSLPAGWVRISSSTSVVPVSDPVPHTMAHQKKLQSNATSTQNVHERKKVIAPRFGKQIENDDDDNLRTSGDAEEPISNWRKRSGLDQRLAFAAQGTDNTQQIMALFGKKVAWLTTYCPKQYRSNECEKFTYVLTTKFENISICSKDAKTLVEMAAECMDAVAHSRYLDTKQGFARLARKLIFIAKPLIKVEEDRRAVAWLDEEAEKMLSPQKKN